MEFIHPFRIPDSARASLGAMDGRMRPPVSSDHVPLQRLGQYPDYGVPRTYSVNLLLHLHYICTYMYMRRPEVRPVEPGHAGGSMGNISNLPSQPLHASPIEDPGCLWGAPCQSVPVDVVRVAQCPNTYTLASTDGWITLARWSGMDGKHIVSMYVRYHPFHLSICGVERCLGCV